MFVKPLFLIANLNPAHCDRAAKTDGVIPAC